MIQLHLNVDGEWVELDQLEGVDFTLNKTFENLLNPADYINSYSKTISIPGTPHNNIVFDNIYRLDSSNRNFDATQKTEFYLSYDGQFITSGYMKVNDITRANNVYVYNITLFGRLGETLQTLMDLNFADGSLDDPLSDNLKLDRFLIQSSWENELPRLPLLGARDIDIIGFAPDDHGLNTDFDSKSISDGHKFSTIGSIINSHSGVTVGDAIVGDGFTERQMAQFRSYHQKPYLYINKLWQIFQRASEEKCNYKLELDPEWFSNQNPYYSDLVYTLPDLYKEGVENVEVFDLGDTETLRVFPTNGDPSGINIAAWNVLSFNGQTVFNVSEPKDVELSLDLTQNITACDKTSNLSKIAFSKDNALRSVIRVVDNATNAVLGTWNAYFADDDTNMTIPDSADMVGIVPVTRVRFSAAEGAMGMWSFQMPVKLKFHADSGFRIESATFFMNTHNPYRGRTIVTPWFDFYWSGQTNTSKLLYRNVRYNTSDPTRTGMRISMAKLFPTEVAPFQVLIDYCKMFGLMMKLDDINKTIIITTRHNWFGDGEGINGSNFVDWSDKMDASRGFALKPVSFESKFVDLTYDASSDENAKIYLDKYQIQYGAKRISTDYEFDTKSSQLTSGIKPSIVISRKMATLAFIRSVVTNDDAAANIYAKNHNEVYISNLDSNKSANVWGNFYFRNPNQPIDLALGNDVVSITDDDLYQIHTNTFGYTTDPSVTINMTKIPTLSTISADGQYSIMYDEPREYYSRSVSNPPYTCIYNLLLKEWLDERYYKWNKVLTTYFKLSPSDWNTKFVLVDNVLYMVNKIIDYNPSSSEPTKCELVQVHNQPAYRSGITFDYLVVNPTLILAGAGGDRFSVSVKSNETIDFDVDVDWVDFYEEGDHWTINISPNSALARRVGRISIITDHDHAAINIIQSGNTHFIYVNPNSLLFNYNGGNQTVTVSSSDDIVSTTVNVGWISVTQDTLNRTQWVISAAPNSALASRAGVVTFTSSAGRTASINVSQSGSVIISRDDDPSGGIHIITPKKLTSVGVSTTPVVTDNDAGDMILTYPTLPINTTETKGGGDVEITYNESQAEQYRQLTGDLIILVDGKVI